MKDAIIDAVTTLPPELAVVVLAALPIIEVRGSIPVAITVYDLSPVAAIAWSLFGNIAAGAITLIISLPIIRAMIAHSDRIRQMWERYIHSLQTRNEQRFARYGALALVLFVAIPLPMTGIFTGAVAASVFGISPRRALPLLLLGSVIASVIVTVITLGAAAVLS